MRLSLAIRLTLAGLAASVVLIAQPAPPRVFGPPDRPETAPKPVAPNPATPQTPAQQGARPAGQPAGQPAVQQPAQPGAQPATQPQTAPPAEAPRLTDSGAFIMPN